MDAATHRECLRVLTAIETNTTVQVAIFMEAVDTNMYPDYKASIKTPMDLGTIKKNLGSKVEKCKYKSLSKFAKHLRLVFQNAKLYNKAQKGMLGGVYAAAELLQNLSEKELEAAERVLGNNTPGAGFNSASPLPGGSGKDKSKSRNKSKKKRRDSFDGGQQRGPDWSACLKLVEKLKNQKGAKAGQITTIFGYPVDVSVYTDYPRKVPIPIDLSTISVRTEISCILKNQQNICLLTIQQTRTPRSVTSRAMTAIGSGTTCVYSSPTASCTTTSQRRRKTSAR
jgi:hypothetical protein